VKTPTEIHFEREQRMKLSRDRFTALMVLAGYTITKYWELANAYWPLHPDYDDVREPWWLFLTDRGLIMIGWRKRVINIDWSATPIRKIVTGDNVTKSTDMVHAYSEEKALEYLKELLI
jgi:hypothetical protein